MITFSRRAAGLAALLTIAACAERPSPLEPAANPGVPAPPSAAVTAAARERGIHERLARRFAIALRDPDFRATVYTALRRSGEREGKVHLQGFLAQDGGRQRHRLAQLAMEAEAAVAEDLEQAAPIEIYFPVPAHRRGWLGDLNVLVATAEADREVPVAFDSQGSRQSLDPNHAPATPVIALGRAEISFTSGAARSSLVSGVPGANAFQTPGLYMTYARFNSTFEGWLKGKPEFEVHILGQDGISNSMKSYQCAGESAGTPYQFNMDDVVWGGSVLLFSQTQLDAYKAAHPNQAVRVFVVEDDDGPCVIRTDSARVSKLFQQLITTYGVLTGGRDSTLFSIKTFQKATSLYQLLKAVWSILASQDDVVGSALEDVVAHEWAPGANWIIKGDNAVTNGAIRLEMH